MANQNPNHAALVNQLKRSAGNRPPAGPPTPPTPPNPSAAPAAPPPPAYSPTGTPTPPRRQAPIPRRSLVTFLVVTISGLLTLFLLLGLLVLANLKGYGPAIVRYTQVRVVAPRVSQFGDRPWERPATNPAGRPATPAPTPKADQTPPAPTPKPRPLAPLAPPPDGAGANGASAEKPRCGLGNCWQEGDPIPQTPAAPAPYCCWAPAPPPPCCQPSAYYRPAPDWQTNGHGSNPLPGTPDNQIVWKRHVLPGGSEIYIPHPRHRQ